MGRVALYGHDSIPLPSPNRDGLCRACPVFLVGAGHMGTRPFSMFVCISRLRRPQDKYGS